MNFPLIYQYFFELGWEIHLKGVSDGVNESVGMDVRSDGTNAQQLLIFIWKVKWISFLNLTKLRQGNYR